MYDPSRILRIFFVTALALGHLCAMGPLMPAQAGDDAQLAETLIREGRLDQSIIACSLCHSESGQGDVNFGFGNLTGQSKDYIAKQLRAFQTGERENKVMQRISKGLTDRDIAALAAYYSKIKVAAPAFSVNKVPKVAIKLATEGDDAREIPACNTCHGLDADAGGLTIANINGQHSTYIVNQLVSWQAGGRDPNSVMAQIAPKLTIPEINALAIYYASRTRKAKE